jgi:hypothetical protein
MLLMPARLGGVWVMTLIDKVALSPGYRGERDAAAAEADPYWIACPCNPQTGILKRYRTTLNTTWPSLNRRKDL